MKYIIQIAVAVLLMAVIFWLPIQVEPEYSLKLKGLTSYVDAAYTFTEDGKHLIYKSYYDPIGRGGEEYEAKVFDIETGGVVLSGEKIGNDILFDQIISVDKQYFNIETGRRIPNFCGFDHASFLFLNPDSSLYSNICVSKHEKDHYFANHTLKIETPYIDSLPWNDARRFQIYDVVKNEMLFDHSFGTGNLISEVIHSDSTVLLTTENSSYRYFDTFIVNYFSGVVTYKRTVNGKYGFTESKHYKTKAIQNNDYIQISKDEFSKILFKSLSPEKLERKLRIDKLEKYAGTPDGAYLFLGGTLHENDNTLSLYEKDKILAYKKQKAKKSWGVFILTIYIILVILAFEYKPFSTIKELRDEKKEEEKRSLKQKTAEDDVADEMKNTLIENLKDENLDLNDAELESLASKSIDKAKEILDEAFMNQMADMFTGGAVDEPLMNPEEVDAEEEEEDDELDLDDILTTEDTASSNFDASSESLEQDEYLVQCEKCKQLYRANESLNQAMEYPERASIVTMINGGDALVFRCPHCNQIDVTSSTSVQAFKNGLLYKLEQENKTMKDVKLAYK